MGPFSSPSTPRRQLAAAATSVVCETTAYRVIEMPRVRLRITRSSSAIALPTATSMCVPGVLGRKPVPARHGRLAAQSFAYSMAELRRDSRA
jgi:hypothetical protein